MRNYKVFYKGKSVDVQAESSYAAQEAGAKLFKTKKTWEVAVVLVDVPVSTSSI